MCRTGRTCPRCRPHAHDLERYPHYGGRTRPDECAVCHKILRCYATDVPEGAVVEAVCHACLRRIIDLAWEHRPDGPRGRDEASIVPPPWSYLDEDCPKRGPALSHTRDGGLECIHCGVRTYVRKVPK